MKARFDRFRVPVQLDLNNTDHLQKAFSQVRLFLLFLAAIILSPALPAVSAPEELPAGIEVHEYTGWREAIFLNATEIPVQAVMIPAVGGRIVHFSLDGQNILFENFAAEGRILAPEPEELWTGGYQCDLGPESRGLPPHLQLVEGIHRWRALGDFAMKETSQPDAASGAVLEKEFVMAPDTGELGVIQRLRNTSKRDVTYCLWDRTLCKGGGFAFFPLNPKSRFKAGWSLQRPRDGKSYYDGTHPESLETRVLGGVLVAQTTGQATRLGADSDAGWIAYARGKVLFVKYFPYWPGANYADGNSVELYFDLRATELNPLSPQITLKPGRSAMFPEKWLLLPLDKEVATPEQARELVKRIPPSPFGMAEPFAEPSRGAQ